MKNTVLLIIAVTLSIMSYGQIKSFTLISGKEYPNNTRTQYLQLDQAVNQDYHIEIKGEILSHPLITNFSFYDKTDYSQIMFTSDISLNGNDIIDIMNQVIEKSSITSENTNSKVISTQDKYLFYKFNISDTLDEALKKQIISALLKDPSIVDVKISSQEMKIKTIREMTSDEIIILVSELDFEMTPIISQ